MAATRETVIHWLDLLIAQTRFGQRSMASPCESMMVHPLW